MLRGRLLLRDSGKKFLLFLSSLFLFLGEVERERKTHSLDFLSPLFPSLFLTFLLTGASVRRRARRRPEEG